MQVEQLSTASGQVMAGPLLITPQVFGDDRGFFFESWNQRRFDQAVGAATSFCQDNHSQSSRGVLRGLHLQLEPEPQGKLVRCTSGAIWDVAVDLRRSSTTFAHGFLTLSNMAEVLYKASGFWSKACERSLGWNDPELAITWPLEQLGISEPLLAEKDAAAPSLAQAVAAGEVFV